MILGLDIGASNIKGALVDKDLRSEEQIQVPAMSAKDTQDALLKVRRRLFKSSQSKLDQIAVTCSPFLPSGAYDESLFEMNESIENVFKSYMKAKSEPMFLGRDGGFHHLREMEKDYRTNYLNIVKYVDANWLPLVYLIKEMHRVSNFVCVSFGTSSTSLIPVLNGIPQVELTENRLSSSKLVLMGKIYTPVISFMREIAFRGSKIPWNPYDNQLTIGEVASLLGAEKSVSWTTERENLVFATSKRMCWSVGGDMKLVSPEEITDMCKQVIESFRDQLVRRVRSLMEGIPQEAKTIYVCGLDNRFFIDLFSKDYKCVDTGLVNTSTAYGTAVLFARYLESNRDNLHYLTERPNLDVFHYVQLGPS